MSIPEDRRKLVGDRAPEAAPTKIDSELVEQFETSTREETLVEAVVKLRPETPAEIVPSAERTEELTHLLLERVSELTGQAASRLNVFKNLGSFVVSAHPAFIRHLMGQPEVDSVVANQHFDPAD